MIDKDRYEAAARARKTDFFIKLILFSVLILSAVAVGIALIENRAAVLAALVAAAWCAYSLYKTVRESRPWDLFSTEYTGYVVKIHTGTAPGTAELYIAKDGGGVVLIRALSAECAKCYKLRDRVHHIRGTTCPIITGRECELIPCPICAKPHTARTAKKCPYCNS